MLCLDVVPSHPLRRRFFVVLRQEINPPLPNKNRLDYFTGSFADCSRLFPNFLRPLAMPLTHRKFQRIFTLGPEGTFSNQAAQRVCGEGFDNIVYCLTLPQVTSQVSQDEQSLGVIPIENSVSGTVNAAQNSLIDFSAVIIGELTIDVHYGLVAYGPLDQVKQYYCHAVAFNQCQRFVSQHLPQAQVLYSDSNMDSAARFTAAAGQPVAAIVPLSIAQDRPTLKPHLHAGLVEDEPNNRTRFLVIQKKPAEYTPDLSKAKTSIYIELHEDRHSLLFEVLREFHVYNINLCRLESRPSRVRAWQYGFFIDFYNNQRTGACLEDFKRNRIEFKVLGSYDPVPQ